jgi:superfamily II DNA or RNA helicase
VIIPKIQHALSVGSAAQVPYSAELAGLLTYEDKYGEEVKLYQHSEGFTWMNIPRELVDYDTVLKDYRCGAAIPSVVPVVPPRGPDQERCLKESVVLLKNGVSHIAQAPTGWGKTYHGVGVACALGERTLIIVTKNDLIKPWHDTMKKFFGLKDEDIGHCQQKKCVWEGKRFVVAMVHSLVEREYPAEFYKAFGLVIFDEVHRLGADYFEQVCYRFPAFLRLGLSATAKRKDGRFKSFEAHIGKLLVEGKWVPMSPKILVKQTGWKVPTYKVFDTDEGKWVTKELTMAPGKLGLVVKKMAHDQARNAEIAQFVKAAYDKGRRPLILSDLKEHLQLLFHACAQVGIPGQDMAFYQGGMKQMELEAAKLAPVCFATFAFTTEGTDNPVWDALVMASPKAEVQQAIGRVLRFLPDKPQPVILDLVDNHSLFKSYHYSRLKNYYAVGATILQV